MTAGATGQRRGATPQKPRPIKHLTSRRLDFPGPFPLRQSYIVASSYRCGSTFLCQELWRTGLLGAPSEYFNSRNRPTAKSIQEVMVERLNATSAEDYLEKLLKCRTSPNGIFGMKAHFHDFEAALKRIPKLLETLAPVAYIYIDRQDQLAQAVSMAKALQTDTWSSLGAQNKGPVQYDRELISTCLGRLERQALGWKRWFEANKITPFVVTYESLTADTAGIIRGIVEYFGVENDEPYDVHPPAVEKQSDETNHEWKERFERELREGVTIEQPDKKPPRQPAALRQAPAQPRRQGPDRKAPRQQPARSQTPQNRTRADAGIANDPQAPASLDAAGKLFDGYQRFVEKSPSLGGNWPARLARLKYRYQAMVGTHRELFRNARVFDMASSDGFWVLAALEAGAAHVVGSEVRARRIDAAKKLLEEFGTNRDSYEIVHADVIPAMHRFDPGEFDVILCKGFPETSDARLLFSQFQRLRPKHVILDTGISRGKGPILRFTARQADASASAGTAQMTVLSTPNHDLIEFLCEHYGFRWQLVDAGKVGVSDWTDIRDYESDRRRTYVLSPTTENVATAVPQPRPAGQHARAAVAPRRPR